MEPPFTDDLRAAFLRAGGKPLAQAATVSPDGLPEVRTVVLRGLGTDAEVWFASDARTGKFASLAASPWLELCLFDAGAGVQWRLRGRAAVHAGDALARRAWRELPPATRALFFSAPPGEPLPEGVDTAQPEGDAAATTPDPPPPFAVVRLPPARCDRLLLGPPLARRRWWLESGRWTGHAVVP